ncbi:high frequency lysogenization protein [Methylomagnum ishizawai]|uniref:High frequency lysogenization protein HflD homolog n=1 Tax=Methylomagnum ishizawai TaxID=1760988 RepID=A0A1Y6D223_9GAMM|nr:high frequency lysogenization protein HflD [Methylomagnum ishizawai]SMF94045.1 high frequency lysogenization protein [Methylomagnum ishizawai]
MIKTLPNQAIALAGLSQAVCLVQQIAKKGAAEPEPLRASIASTLKIDADDVLDVYGGLEGVRLGLRCLDNQLSGPERANPEQARYASTLLFLERALMKEPAMVEAIGVSVHRAAELAETVGVLDEGVLKILAEAYSRTLSQLRPRVLVAGEQRFLAEGENADKIRALLLAGVRSAVLWRQCGGARWKLLFQRGRLQQEARQFLKAL